MRETIAPMIQVIVHALPVPIINWVYPWSRERLCQSAVQQGLAIRLTVTPATIADDKVFTRMIGDLGPADLWANQIVQQKFLDIISTEITNGNLFGVPEIINYDQEHKHIQISDRVTRSIELVPLTTTLTTVVTPVEALTLAVRDLLTPLNIKPREAGCYAINGTRYRWRYCGKCAVVTKCPLAFRYTRAQWTRPEPEQEFGIKPTVKISKQESVKQEDKPNAETESKT